MGWKNNEDQSDHVELKCDDDQSDLQQLAHLFQYVPLSKVYNV